VEDAFAVVVGAAVFLEAGRLNEVELATDERFDAFGFGGIVEVDGAKKVSVVGEREGGHAEGNCPVHQAINAASAVEQTVVRMNVEMDEIQVGGRHSRGRQRPSRNRARRKARFAPSEAEKLWESGLEKSR
jgi:hypothetical protein